MSKKFVTSDTWFNRLMEDNSNMDVVDNNDAIISNWNNTVGENDDVYVLGGFGISNLYNIIIRLNGKIHFLDNFYTEDERKFISEMKNNIKNSIIPNLKNRFIFEKKQIVILDDMDVVLSYFPLSDWPGKSTGTFCFHGINDSSNLEEHYISCVLRKWNGKPVDIDRVVSNIKKIEDIF